MRARYLRQNKMDASLNVKAMVIHKGIGLTLGGEEGSAVLS